MNSVKVIVRLLSVFVVCLGVTSHHNLGAVLEVGQALRDEYVSTRQMRVCVVLVIGSFLANLCTQSLVRASIRSIGSDLLRIGVDACVSISQRKATRIIVNAVKFVTSIRTVLILVAAPVGRDAFIIFCAFELVLFTKCAIILIVTVPTIPNVVAFPFFRNACRIQALELVF